MSYVPPPPGYAPQPAPTGPGQERPSTVSAATGLLYLLAAMQLVSLLIAIPTFSVMSDVYTEAYKGTPLEGSTGAVVGMGIAVAVVQTLIVVAAAITLAILVGRGKQAARIVTWVFLGIGVCCYGGSLLSGALSGALSGLSAGSGTTTGPDAAEIQRMMSEGLPAWQQPVALAVAGIQLLLTIAIIVLLVLRPSNEFFRRPEPGWTPPAYPTV